MDSHGEHSESWSPKPTASNVGHHKEPDEEEHRPVDSSYLDFCGRPLSTLRLLARGGADVVRAIDGMSPMIELMVFSLNRMVS